MPRWFAILKVIGGIGVIVLAFWTTSRILDHFDFSHSGPDTGGTIETTPAPAVGAIGGESAQAMSSRDAQRKSDLHTLQLALEAYAKSNGSYLVAGSGSEGAGVGYIDNPYPGSTSVTQALFKGGYLTVSSIEDPTKTPGYLIFLCDGNKRYSISATLENPSPEDIGHAQTTCNALGLNGTYSVYGKNYSVGN